LKINFSAKITSVATASVTSSNAAGAGGSWGYNAWWCCSANLNAAWSNTRSSAYSSQEKRQYTMNISVKAVQDGLPGGMRRVLNLLEDGFVKGFSK
jgi:hypothetical protein